MMRITCLYGIFFYNDFESRSLMNTRMKKEKEKQLEQHIHTYCQHVSHLI